MAHTSVSRDVNRYIRETAAYFTPTADGFAHSFLCVCGCADRVRMTLAEYDASAGEALLAGHAAPAAKRQAAATLAAE